MNYLKILLTFLFDYVLAQIILDLLNEDDQLMLFTISNTVHTMDNANKFYTMDSNNKSQLRKFVDSLEKDMAVTNHTLAFQYTFDWIKSQFDSGALPSHGKTTPLQILYVSRGLITQLSETKNVLEVIAAGQSRLKRPVVINSCAIILGKLSVFYQSSLFFFATFFFEMKSANFTLSFIPFSFSIETCR